MLNQDEINQTISRSGRLATISALYRQSNDSYGDGLLGASSTHQNKKQETRQNFDILFSNTQTTPTNVSHNDFRVAVFKAGYNQFTLSTAQESNI
ncbi:unnamed protein product [Mucor hiemalis]